MPDSSKTCWLLIVATVYLGSAAVLGGWIMDDAGISYAYARNLATGHGLVSQPGATPVEGFSNFLWVLLLAPFFAFRLFHPVITVKLLGAALVVGSLASLQRTLALQGVGKAPARIATLLIAAAPPIVIWTTSGFENSLTLFLAVALYGQLVLQRPGWEIKSGLLTALLALNHPEQVLLAAAGILVCIGAAPVRDGDRGGRVTLGDSVRRAAIRLAKQVGAMLAILGPFLVFRLLVFGLPLPHTYYAKRTHLSPIGQLISLFERPYETLGRVDELARGILGPFGPAMLLATLAAVGFLAVRRRLRRYLAVAVLLQLAALAAYLWMPDDWMGEFRFATVVTTFSLLSFALTGYSLLSTTEDEQSEDRIIRRRRRLTTAYLLVVVLAFVDFLPRLVRYAQRPALPFAQVLRRAQRFDAYARILGLEEGSIYLPDIGGMLYGSQLSVQDAAGLIDPGLLQVQRQGTPLWQSGNPEFYEQIFEERQPTFISLHRFWTKVSALEADPRFIDDYVPINSHIDRYLERAFGDVLHSGDWVRLDALPCDDALHRLREYHEQAPPGPLINAVLEQWTSAIRRQSRSNAQRMLDAWDTRVVQRRPGDAAALYGQVLMTEPDHYGATYQLAVSLDEASRPHAARPWWERVLRAADAAEDHVAYAEAYHRLGNDSMDAGLLELYDRENPSRAVEHFRVVLLLNAEHYGANYQIAVAFDKDSRGEEAVPYWRKTLGLAEKYSDSSVMKIARGRLN